MARSSRYGTHRGLINLNVLTEEVHNILNQKLINTALQIHGTLRSTPPRGTPIDTRWASNNWTISLDGPRADTLGEKPRRGTQLSQSSTTDTGIVALLQFDIRKNSVIYIQNNAPYIARLNRGWSKQSPAGFVEAAIDEAMLANGLFEV